MLTAALQYRVKNVPDALYIAEKLGRSFYVDDLLTGANRFQEAMLLYEKTKVMLAGVGIPLRRRAASD